MMTRSGTLSHDELLTLTTKVAAAAADEDLDRLAATATHLFKELAAHLSAERTELLRVSLPAKRLLLAHGQDRILDLLYQVLTCAQSSTPGACHCDRIAQQLLSELALQAEDERLAGVDRRVSVERAEGDAEPLGAGPRRG
jgi:hypothetical protein